MTRELTAEDVRAGIVPKSDQLNADDLVAGPVTVEILRARVGDKERPFFLDLKGYDGRPYKPCTMMRRLLVSVFGDEPGPWVGKRLTLYRDPQVQYKGDKVGGIRISHVSGIVKPETLILTEKRGRSVEWVVYPIAEAQPEEAPKLSPADLKFIEEANRELREADSLDVLKGYGEILKGKSKAIQDALRPVYAERKKELSTAPD